MRPVYRITSQKYHNQDSSNLTEDWDLKEDGIGYIDDIALLAIAANFIETTRIIRDMMTREDGGEKWSISHNSRFKVIKSAISHYTRSTKLLNSR